MADEGVGAVQDVAAATVVLFELDLVLDLEFGHKIGHVANPRPPEGIDALVIVTHSHHAAALAGLPGFGLIATATYATAARKHLDPGVLQLVGVLELVDQDVAKTPLVVFADGRVVAQQLEAAQHQFAKINHAFFLALIFIQLVNLDLFAGFRIVGLYCIGPQAIFLATTNEPLGFFGRVPLVVNAKLLVKPFDGAQLVLRVQDLESLGQIGHFVMRPQKAVAQAMKGADPHAARVHRQHGREARHHLFGGLVGKSNRQHAAGRHRAVLQQPGDAGGQHPGFAGARARQDERVFIGQHHGRALLGVEVV